MSTTFRNLFAALSIACGLGLATTALAAPYAAITDVTSYTGSVTAYDTLADAQNGANATGTYLITNRATAAPSNTPYRDVAIYMINDYAPADINSNFLMTAWYYTTVPGDFGVDNPNNTNDGFLQLADANSSTITTGSGVFSNLQGGVYKDYRLQVSGTNATHAADDARLWPAATSGAASATSYGTFHSYALDVTYSGLDGQLIAPGIYESTLDPTSVNGTFKAVFENTSVGHEKFYTVDFTFGLDNWAVAQGAALIGGGVSSSQFVGTIPEPGTIALAGLAFVGLAGMRRRRK